MPARENDKSKKKNLRITIGTLPPELSILFILTISDAICRAKSHPNIGRETIGEFPKRCKRGAAKPRVEAAKQAGTLGVDADPIKPCKGGAGFCIALTGPNIQHM
jgi:hypothetical protein